MNVHKTAKRLRKDQRMPQKTDWLSATYTVLFPRTRITTNDHKCSAKCWPKKIQLKFNVQDTHKYICHFTKRRTPRLKMFVFSENRTNFQKLSTNTQDQNLVCYQMLCTDSFPMIQIPQSNYLGVENRGVAVSPHLSDGFSGLHLSLSFLQPNSLTSLM